MSIRLLVVVEGQTEEGFVNRVLAPHLWDFNVYAKASLVTTSYRGGRRLGKGGGRYYRHWKDDLRLHRKQDSNRDRWFTSMVDLYGMAELKDGFPGFEDSRSERDPYRRVEALEVAFREDIGDHQFVPYIQLYEFEALVLADPRKLECEYLDHEKEIAALEKIAASKSSPEEINDGKESAPSKRIIQALPHYAFNKPRVGTLVTEKIGIAHLRSKCPHFDQWVRKLEALGGSQCGIRAIAPVS